MAGGRYLGVFREVDTAVKAIESLRAAGMTDLESYSPLPNHELEHALHRPQSPVRLFTLVGALTGTAAGFALAIWTSLDWPLVTGGKPIVSLPAFVVIAFELTILLGALSTVAAVGLFSVLLGKRGIAYDPRFSDDQIGIFVPSGGDQTGAVEQMLRSAGAVEVRREAA